MSVTNNIDEEWKNFILTNNSCEIDSDDDYDGSHCINNTFDNGINNDKIISANIIDNFD